MSLLTQEEIFAAFESSDGTWESAGRAVIAKYEEKREAELQIQFKQAYEQGLREGREMAKELK